MFPTQVFPEWVGSLGQIFLYQSPSAVSAVLEMEELFKPELADASRGIIKSIATATPCSLSLFPLKCYYQNHIKSSESCLFPRPFTFPKLTQGCRNGVLYIVCISRTTV